MALGLLLMGFLLGMRHSLEADHLAAVATLATRSDGLRDSLRHGVAWGIGHTLTLLLFGSVALSLGGAMPIALARWLELAVGVLLLGLGAEVLWRLARERVHFHLHTHAGGEVHFHAHSHAGERVPHVALAHRHTHRRRLPLRALLIGLVHGMAGSAALILLTLQTVESVWTGFLYVLLFGLGSTFGMALLSLVIAIPLRRAAHGLTWVHHGLHALVGVTSLVVGSLVIAGT
ncbi:MAG: urease accessory protein [Chromatiaceae bacterium]|nr:urease accessory protein [Gammaproteobacteria bacterium]MCP5306945.1 urease accessory protein [Chromatiaceae bacterium]